MKITSRSLRPLTVGLLIAAFAGLGLHDTTAAEKGGKKAANKANANANAQSEAELLREAYQILERADHDYKGHRHAAMHQIEEAAKHLGVHLQGDGKGKEPQAVSDAQLRDAKAKLEQAHGMVKGHKNGKVPEHINHAIRQLDIALSIK